MSTSINEIQNTVGDYIKVHEQEFVHALIQDIKTAMHTPFEIGLYNLGNEPDVKPFKIDSLKFLQDQILILTSPGLDIPVFGSEKYSQYLRNFYEFEHVCEERFWENPGNSVEFKSIAIFNAFQDIIVKPESVKKFKTRSFLFDIDGWVKYVEDLLLFCYPEFDCVKTGQTILFRSSDSDDNAFKVYLEYDAKLFRSNLEKGELILPPITILLVKKTVMTEFESHGQFMHTSMIKVGNLSNPFIHEPCSPIDVFFARNTFVEIEPGYFDTVHQMMYDQLNDGTVRIHNSNDFGITLQKHLFFYFRVSKFFVSSYLKLLKKI